jgi:phage tail P2-like protein
MNDLLPPSATQEERALAMSAGRVSDVANPLRSLWNPETCPLHILPWLAWAMSVETWDTNWAEYKKREVIKNAIVTAMTKGTSQSVTDALNSIGVAVTMQEWFNQTPPAAPHTFKVRIASQDASFEAQAFMVNEINRTKPLRAHYLIEFGVTSSMQIGVIGILRPTVFTRLDGQTNY